MTIVDLMLIFGENKAWPVSTARRFVLGKAFYLEKRNGKAVITNRPY